MFDLISFAYAFDLGNKDFWKLIKETLGNGDLVEQFDLS